MSTQCRLQWNGNWSVEQEWSRVEDVWSWLAQEIRGFNRLVRYGLDSDRYNYIAHAIS